MYEDSWLEMAYEDRHTRDLDFFDELEYEEEVDEWEDDEE